MYQKLCHVAMKHDKPVNGNAKSKSQTMNATFGKIFDVDSKVSLVEETIPNDSNVWNHWTGNRESGMDAVAQANGIDKTQLSNGHRNRPKKRTWKTERNSNLLQEWKELS